MAFTRSRAVFPIHLMGLRANIDRLSKPIDERIDRQLVLEWFHSNCSRDEWNDKLTSAYELAQFSKYRWWCYKRSELPFLDALIAKSNRNRNWKMKWVSKVKQKCISNYFSLPFWQCNDVINNCARWRVSVVRK